VVVLVVVLAPEVLVLRCPVYYNTFPCSLIVEIMADGAFEVLRPVYILLIYCEILDVPAVIAVVFV